MNIFTIAAVEFKKIRRSKILLIMIAATVILWLPNVLNADLNFDMSDIGISPEDSFFIQGFMGMAWFIYPAVMVVTTVLLVQTERTNHGILKMLSLPVSTPVMCLAKFIVLAVISAVFILLMTAGYYIAAVAAGTLHDYNFILSPAYVLPFAGKLYLASLPMLTVFWLIAVCISTPVFSIGAGLVLIVPSVLINNTKGWFLYPMGYPFYLIMSEYGDVAENIGKNTVDLIPWIPVAVCISLFCLLISCLCFGRNERR